LFFVALQPLSRLADHVDHFLKHELLLRIGRLHRRQEVQMLRRPRLGPRVADVLAQQKHLELLPRPMLLLAHLVTRPDQIPHRFILRIGHVNAGEFTRPQQPRQLIRIPPVRLDAVARLSRHFGRRDNDALRSMLPDEPAQRIPPWPRLVTTLQCRVGMRCLQFLDQPQHVVVLPADDPITPHLRAVRRGQRHGDGIVVNIQPDEQDAATQHAGLGHGSIAHGVGQRILFQVL
jgi:hypothetical protein